VAAGLCITFGFAKINGSQFTVLDSELTRPMGEVSGFWLTWYYFGFSHAYGTGVALLQIVSGVLLVLPRTVLAGALLLLPIAVNIVLIDVFYGVDLPGTLAAFVLLLCVSVIVASHAGRLWSAILLRTAPSLPSARSLAALAVVMVGAFAFTWWTAEYNNRAPTPIDGVWAVSSQTPSSAGERGWRQVFFEHNRAHLAVFRAESGADERHHFEVDADGVIRVWENWLTRGSLIMIGHRRSETEIELEIASEHGGGRLILRRVRPTL
jgi:hypothetical protein